MIIYARCSCKTYNNSKNKECTKCGEPLKPKRFYIRISENGKRKFEYAGVSVGQARIYADRRSYESRTGVPQDVIAPTLLADFVDDMFIPHYETKNKSAKTEIHKFKTITKFFENMLMGEIKPSDIERFYQWQFKVNAPATAKNRLAIVRRIFNYAIEMGYLSSNPVKTKPIAVNNQRTRYLTADEKIILLDQCRQSKSKDLYPLVFIALNTGMRYSEILAFDYEKDITDKCIVVRAQNSKSGKERIIPLNNDLQKYFNENGFKKFSQHEFRQAFNAARSRAKIENFTFHDLRHTFASDLVNAGVDLYTVQILLGHSTPVMTQRYAHKDIKSLKNAVNKIGGRSRL